MVFSVQIYKNNNNKYENEKRNFVSRLCFFNILHSCIFAINLFLVPLCCYCLLKFFHADYIYHCRA